MLDRLQMQVRSFYGNERPNQSRTAISGMIERVAYRCDASGHLRRCRRVYSWWDAATRARSVSVEGNP